MPRAAGIDFDGIVARYGVSPERLRSLVARASETGFPAPCSDERWDAEAVEAWMSDLVRASHIAVLLQLKREQTVTAYVAKPGYFVEPDEVEVTPAGYKRKRWTRVNVLAWDAGRSGRGNREPRSGRRPVPQEPAGVDMGQPTLSSREAAAVLGFADTASFASAHAQGRLRSLGDPIEPAETTGPPRPSRRWDTALVLAEAERRRAASEGHRARVGACLQALTDAAGEPVSAVVLQASDESGAPLAAWQSALAQARRQFKRP
ncbi:hypothetical protein [Streptacidiphilus neutrinimicus]|uniref:hypothetical protein n=1 Tax=Streptacidiphilus neutrinimicus TaxID=105420 RepID=UPI00069332EC|nr:hypothetical protein [Streptacidiphilus neutrinimicus]